ncbi:IS3 family transposase [Vibrio sp. S11_S32]|nr:IS3 family transposase [Vibrio sp. S11_S32]
MTKDGQAYEALFYVHDKDPSNPANQNPSKTNGQPWFPLGAYQPFSQDELNNAPEYNANETYSKNDLIKFNHVNYVARQMVSSVTPTDTNNPWKIFIEWGNTKEIIGTPQHSWPNKVFSPYVDVVMNAVPDFDIEGTWVSDQTSIDRRNEAVDNGSRLPNACLETEIDLRTYRRWYQGGAVQEDQRPLVARPEPANKLTEKERSAILDVCNAPEYATLPPTQIVPTLLDKGVYLGSESTFYRTLRQAGQVEHRGRQRARKKVARPSSYTATAPKQVLTWDITYLPAVVRGQHYYLYLIEDIYSRKIVGYEVYAQESGEKAAQLLQRTLMREQCFNRALVLHSDNGSAMKSSTMKAKMEELGVTPSYGRPRVSDDNPYVKSLFRTLKYVPSWPPKGFASLEESRAWVDRFVEWYNNEHKHRGLNYVTPSERHAGKDSEILQKRAAVLEVRREQNPERWSGEISKISNLRLRLQRSKSFEYNNVKVSR